MFRRSLSDVIVAILPGTARCARCVPSMIIGLVLAIQASFTGARFYATAIVTELTSLARPTFRAFGPSPPRTVPARFAVDTMRFVDLCATAVLADRAILASGVVHAVADFVFPDITRGAFTAAVAPTVGTPSTRTARITCRTADRTRADKVEAVGTCFALVLACFVLILACFTRNTAAASTHAFVLPGRAGFTSSFTLEVAAELLEACCTGQIAELAASGCTLVLVLEVLGHGALAFARHTLRLTWVALIVACGARLAF
jgi:hypothetical protein